MFLGWVHNILHISEAQFCPFRFFLVWIFPICGDILVTGDRQFYESLPPFMPLLLSHRNVDIPLKGNTFQGYYEDEDNRLSTTHLHLELVISICCFWPVSCRSYFASSVLFAFNECLSCVTGAEGQTECLWQVICLNVDYHKRQKASRPQLQTLWTGARRGREDGEAEFSSPHKTTPFSFQTLPHPPQNWTLLC